MEHRENWMEAGLIVNELGALDFHCAEWKDRHLHVEVTTERKTPMLHLRELERSRVDEQLDRVLVTQPVAAGDRVVEVKIHAVVVLDHPGGAAFGGNRMAAHGIDLGKQRHLERRIGLGGRNGSA